MVHERARLTKVGVLGRSLAALAMVGLFVPATVVSSGSLQSSSAGRRHKTEQPAVVRGSSNALPTKTKQRVVRAYRRLPVSFVANSGQSDASVLYYALGDGFAFYFKADGVVLSFTNGDRDMALRLRPLDTSPTAKLEAHAPAVGTINSFTSSQHRTNLPSYQELAYRGLWPGIVLVFRGSAGRLQYEIT